MSFSRSRRSPRTSTRCSESKAGGGRRSHAAHTTARSEAVDEIANRRPTAGLAGGVIRDGRLDPFAAHRLAGVASATPVTENTVFRVASVTKTFTAIAVMQLLEQGSIDLDDRPAHTCVLTVSIWGVCGYAAAEASAWRLIMNGKSAVENADVAAITNSGIAMRIDVSLGVMPTS
jgi:beta-lactamase class A